MVKGLAILIGIIIFSASAYSQEGQRRPPNEKFEDQKIDKRDDRRHDALKAKLNAIETKYLTLLDYDTRREALRLMDEILQMYDSQQSPDYRVLVLTNYVYLTNTVAVVNNVQQSYTTPAMNDNRFSDFMKTLERTSLKQDQFTIIKKITQNNYYTINQEIRLMSFYQFDDDRLEVLRMTYDHVVDKENSHQLYRLMTYASSKEKLKKIVGQE